MLLHKITYQVKTEMSDAKVVVTRTFWAGSKADAAKKRGSVRQINGYMPNSVQTLAVNVPTKKKQLLDFLNIEIAI